MISKVLKYGAIFAALASTILGLLLYTTIPRQLGLYTFLASRIDIWVGLTPAFVEGMEWGYTWKEFYSDATYNQLKGQSAIVTGANSGIGFELAKALAKNGVHVTITCRTTQKCDKAKQEIDDTPSDKPKGKITTLLLDTSSFQSVRKFCQDYVNTIANGKPIDMLFFNAGANVGTPQDGTSKKCMKTTEDGLPELFQINYLSHHLLYQLLQPFLASNARVVSTSSASSYDTYRYKVATDLDTLHNCSQPFIDPSSGANLAYGESKLAQIMWSMALQRKLHGHADLGNVSFNAFHPGLVDTGNANKLFEQTDVSEIIITLFQNHVLPNAWKSPEGALTGLYLATHGNIKGKYYHPQSQEVTNPLALDVELQDKLWDFSMELVQAYMDPL
jgi:NAD(P)-dependent dehydrogenase (short-subunit alcohol dehydrogenase family)